MLISTEAALGCLLENDEGHLGTVCDLFFDDQSWVVRYLVVETGGWLRSRRVLLPPTVVQQQDWPNRRLRVALTQQQIKDSPEVDTDKPVSGQKLMDLENYPAWAPVAWTPEGVVVPPITGAPATGTASSQTGREAKGGSHLRSVKEVTGYHIAALDDEIGHVDELILDDREKQQGPWELRYLVIDTRNWLPSRKVLVAPIWAEAVIWDERRVQMGLTRDQIRKAPEFHPNLPVNRRYEEILYDYYGKPTYWTSDGG
jgi:hypothetical protein